MEFNNPFGRKSKKVRNIVDGLQLQIDKVSAFKKAHNFCEPIKKLLDKEILELNRQQAKYFNKA